MLNPPTQADFRPFSSPRLPEQACHARKGGRAWGRSRVPQPRHRRGEDCLSRRPCPATPGEPKALANNLAVRLDVLRVGHHALRTTSSNSRRRLQSVSFWVMKLTDTDFTPSSLGDAFLQLTGAVGAVDLVELEYLTHDGAPFLQGGSYRLFVRCRYLSCLHMNNRSYVGLQYTPPICAVNAKRKSPPNIFGGFFP